MVVVDLILIRVQKDNFYLLIKRARILFYSPDRVTRDDLINLSYEDLANSKWQGRIVIRQSNNIYNQSLVASLIFNNGKLQRYDY